VSEICVYTSHTFQSSASCHCYQPHRKKKHFYITKLKWLTSVVHRFRAT
jgi:hypothetical protein